jgi:hypothetical protein
MHREHRQNDTALEIALEAILTGFFQAILWVANTLAQFLKALVVGAWRYRFELAVPVIAAAVFPGGFFLRGPIFGALLVVLVLVCAWHLRNWLRDRIGMRAFSRKWEKVSSDNGIPKTVIRSRENVAAGDLLHLELKDGRFSDFKKTEELIAAKYQLRDVRISEDRTNSARAYMLFIRNDPFHGMGPVRWPYADSTALSLWDPIPMGINEEGRTVTISLPEKNILIGGIPGSGKSVALSLIAATAALDPNCKLWIADGKEVELAAWTPVAEKSVGMEPHQMSKMLREVQEIMEQRYGQLKGLGKGGKVRRKIEREDELPLHLVLIDELAFYLKTTENSKLRNEIAERCRDLVARGRAAGIIFVGATQKIDTDTVPSALRDLIDYRIAFNCSTPQASDTILGQGQAALGFNATLIPGDQPGVGYLKAGGKEPFLEKGFWLSDEDIEAIAERASARKANSFLEELSKEEDSDDEA